MLSEKLSIDHTAIESVWCKPVNGENIVTEYWSILRAAGDGVPPSDVDAVMALLAAKASEATTPVRLYVYDSNGVTLRHLDMGGPHA